MKFIYVIFMSILSINVAQAQSFSELKKAVIKEPSVEIQLTMLNDAHASFKNKPSVEQARFWRFLALIQQRNNQFENSIDSVNQSIKITLNNNSKPKLLLARSYRLRSNSIYRISSTKLSYCDDIDKSVALFREILTEPAELAGLLSSQSACLYDRSHSISASLELLNEAINLAQENQLTNKEQATIYNETALIYRKIGIFDKAYEYNLIAKDKWLLAKDYQGVYFMLRNLIVAATDMAEFEMAHQHIKELIEFTNIHEVFKAANFYIQYHSAVLARAQNKWPLAILHFNKALELKKLTSSSAFIKAAYEQLALMQFRNNQLENSFETLTILENEYPNSAPIKTEVIPLQLLKRNKTPDALIKAYELVEESKQNKREFIKKSTATAAKIHDENLEQLDNLLLKQRFNYLAIIVALSSILFIFLLYSQSQRRKRLQKEKEFASTLLKQKNQLLADVSHELGTPLTVLKLQVEALKDDIEEDVQATYDSLDIKLSEIGHLIGDIHQLAQADTGVLKLYKQYFDINDALKLWQRDFMNSIENNGLSFTVINNLSNERLMHLDKDKIKQVLSNLLANSIKYTDTPGEVKLTVDTTKDQLTFILEDSAPGVDENDLANIFERLYRVESSRNRDTGGSGLGLAICKSLIEAHKGKIFAEASSLGGIKITIELPVSLL